MKKLMILFLLFLPIKLFAPIFPQDEKKICEDWQERRFVEKIRETEFSADNLKRLIEILCKHPDIVYAQARLESGEFKSKLFTDYNNIFGMRKPAIRQTTAIGWAMGHARYSHWSESVFDYMYYQQYYEEKLGVDLNYIDYMYFLKMYGYAQDKYYIVKLKRLI